MTYRGDMMIIRSIYFIMFGCLSLLNAMEPDNHLELCQNAASECEADRQARIDALKKDIQNLYASTPVEKKKSVYPVWSSLNQRQVTPVGSPTSPTTKRRNEIIVSWQNELSLSCRETLVMNCFYPLISTNVLFADSKTFWDWLATTKKLFCEMISLLCHTSQDKKNSVRAMQIGATVWVDTIFAIINHVYSSDEQTSDCEQIIENSFYGSDSIRTSSPQHPIHLFIEKLAWELCVAGAKYDEARADKNYKNHDRAKFLMLRLNCLYQAIFCDAFDVEDSVVPVESDSSRVSE